MDNTAERKEGIYQNSGLINGAERLFVFFGSANQSRRQARNNIKYRLSSYDVWCVMVTAYFQVHAVTHVFFIQTTDGTIASV